MKLKPYENSFEHISDELKLLNLRLSFAIKKIRKIFSESKNEFPGLYISDEEVDSILDNRLEEKKTGKTTKDNEYEQHLKSVEKLRNYINDRKNFSLEKNVVLKIQNLINITSISDFELQVILICLASELDPNYEKIYAYLQDDITKKKPTPYLVFRILGIDTKEEQIKFRKYFFPSSSLFRNNILKFEDSKEQFLSRPLKINGGCVNFLLDINIFDNLKDGSLLANFSKFYFQDEFQCLDLSLGLKDPIVNYIKYHLESDKNEKKNRDEDSDELELQQKTKSKNLPILLLGRQGSGKENTVMHVCKELQVSLFIVDIKEMMILANSEQTEDILNEFFCYSLLNRSFIYVKNIDYLDTKEEKLKQLFQILLEYILNSSTVIFLGLNYKSNKPESLYNTELFNNSINIKVPDLSNKEKVEFWKNTLKKYHIRETKDINKLINKFFHFTPGQIIDAVSYAIDISLIQTQDKNDNTKNKKENEASSEQLYESCLKVDADNNLGSLSHKIFPKFTLKDIELPEDRKQQIKEILDHIKYRDLVYREWGFKEHLHLEDGLNILFTGEPGTGKTMAAEILANEADKDLYKIDLSMVISKYIGETEKNINRIFEYAERTNAMIFFDEADAIFGKRTEIKDAHDRYANVEVDYLLQKMDSHNLVVVLASNLSENIDDAFIRRMHSILKFPFPDEQSRLNIWENIFPPQQRDLLDKNINFEFMAKNFETSGAMIKNIAINSAFHAASEQSRKISMKHLLLCTENEFNKNGKPFVKPPKYEDFFV